VQTYIEWPQATVFDLEDFGSDLSTSSAPSPASPMSPLVFGNSYALPAGDDWVTWDKVEYLPESDELLNAELVEAPILVPTPPRSVSISMAVNPMDLASPKIDESNPDRRGLNATQPLFFNIPMPVPQPLSEPGTRQPPSSRYAADNKTSPSTSPMPEMTPRTQPTKATERCASRKPKRKYSRTASGGKWESQRSSPSPPPPARGNGRKKGVAPTKMTHNLIEKRYRTNLNDKIAALRDSIPALRVAVRRTEDQSSEEEEGATGLGQHCIPKSEIEEEDLGGLAPAQKLNKAVILSKATEYIVYLEKKNRNLAKENAELRSRVEGLEMLLFSRVGSSGFVD
jgi:hypothetical protein